MQPAQRLIISFASAGHFLHHVLTGLFLTLAVILEGVWQRPYAEIIALWTLGAAMIGVGAPLAGWLADRFGHARMMMAFDVVYRWLMATGYRVTYVRNITDIEDKIIRRAVERGITIRALTDEMIAAMHRDFWKK